MVDLSIAMLNYQRVTPIFFWWIILGLSKMDISQMFGQLFSQIRRRQAQVPTRRWRWRWLIGTTTLLNTPAELRVGLEGIALVPFTAQAQCFMTLLTLVHLGVSMSQDEFYKNPSDKWTLCGLHARRPFDLFHPFPMFHFSGLPWHWDDSSNGLLAYFGTPHPEICWQCLVLSHVETYRSSSWWFGTFLIFPFSWE